VGSQEVAWFGGLDRPHMSNVIEQEALINLLEKKGVITKVELLQEIKESSKKQV
jgi:hypothetical protein